jgi:tetratricopeptide (TPR) repeat protein
MAFVAEAIQFLRDRHRAEHVYRLLLPFRQRNVIISFVACLGSAERYLGLLAATLGRWDDAAHHFEAALAMNARMGARPYIALTSYDYARLMPVDADEAARARAIALAGDALRLAREIGMRRLERDAGELLERLEKRTMIPDVSRSRDDVPCLEKAGDLWILTHRGERLHLKDAKGFVYVAELLRQAGREVHVLDLVALARPARRQRGCDVVECAPSSYEDEVVDARARRAYRLRLRELTSKLESSMMSADPEEAACAREEIVALRRELTRAVGIGRRPRHSSDTERARVNVARTIRLALGRIIEASPALGSHFASSVRTGTFCAYVPAQETPASATSGPAQTPTSEV